MRWVPLLLLLPTLAGCPRLRVARVPPQERGAQKLIAELRERWQKGAFEPLALLFAPECRVACTGFVPTPTRLGERVLGQWWPRMLGGTLVGDLLLARRSYARIDRLELAPVELRVYHLEVVLRARLLIEGRDPAGRRLQDRGLLDLRLRQTPAGFRIASLAPRRVLREVTLLPEERAAAERAEAASGSSSRPTASSDGESATSAPTAEGEPEAEPEREPAPSRQRLGELEVVREAKPLRLRALLGGRATLLLVERNLPSPAACQELAREARRRAKVAAAILLLEAPAARVARCELPILHPAGKTRRALGWLRPLLPALLLLDQEGELRRVAGSGAGRLELLEALDALGT